MIFFCWFSLLAGDAEVLQRAVCMLQLSVCPAVVGEDMRVRTFAAPPTGFDWHVHLWGATTRIMANCGRDILFRDCKCCVFVWWHTFFHQLVMRNDPFGIRSGSSSTLLGWKTVNQQTCMHLASRHKTKCFWKTEKANKEYARRFVYGKRDITNLYRVSLWILHTHRGIVRWRWFVGFFFGCGFWIFWRYCRSRLAEKNK